MIEIEAPDGSIVEFPDDTPDSTITSAMAATYGGPKPERTWGEWAKTAPEAVKQGVKQGSTFGFGDELQAGVAAGTVGLANLVNDTGISIPDAYNQALTDFRTDRDTSRQEHPALSIAGEIAGGGITGSGALNALRGANTANTAAGPLAAAGRGLRDGLVSGAVYGYGTGEGSTANRLANSALTGSIGGVAGTVIGGGGGLVANSLASRAARLLEAKRARQARVTPEMSGEGALTVSPDAVSKVIQRLRADYPDESQFQEALRRFQSGEGTLGELGGERTKDLALGAAQYPSGKAATQEFFYGKEPSPGQAPMGGALDSARANVTKSIDKNITDADYFGTLDDIYKKGVEKSKPAYEKAFNSGPVNSDRIQQFLQQPELKTGISRGLKVQRLESVAEGKQFNPTEYGVTGFNEAGDPILGQIPNMRLLDAGKRGLDAMIQDETNPVTGRVSELGRALIQTKQSYVKELKSMNKDYQAALDASGDYLSNASALRAGKEFKGNSKQIARDFAKLGETEQQSYRAGVAQNVREMVDKVRDSGNAYKKVFGTPETRAKLKAVLPEKEFKQLSDDLWASDRIYNFRDKVLGNSTTTSKKISAEEFSANPALQELAMGRPVKAGISGITQWVSKQFDGLSDKTAGEVAKILTAQNDSARWKLIRQIEDSNNKKGAAEKTGSVALKTFYQVEDMLKPYRNAPGITAGNIASQPLRPRQEDIDAGYYGTPPQVDLPTQ
jgi:hypothetical protein